MSRIYHVYFTAEKLHKINDDFTMHWNKSKVGVEAVIDRGSTELEDRHVLTFIYFKH